MRETRDRTVFMVFKSFSWFEIIRAHLVDGDADAVNGSKVPAARRRGPVHHLRGTMAKVENAGTNE